MVLHADEEFTDKLDLNVIVDEFCAGNEYRMFSLKHSNDWNLHQSLVSPEKKVDSSMLDKYKVLI